MKCDLLAVRPPPLVRSEAVKESRSTGSNKILLAAAARHMRRVPRRVAAAVAIMVSQHRGIRRGAIACPVVAGLRIRIARQRSSGGIRSGQHVVSVRVRRRTRLTAPGDDLSFFVKSCGPEDLV